jgi:outer membrane protein OmpA-like peptidoglycan-associated protein
MTLPEPLVERSPKMLLRHATLLAGTALVSACVVPVPYNDRMVKTDTYQRLDAQLQTAAPASRAAQLEQLENLVKLTLPNGLLFADDGAELNDGGKAMLGSLVPALKELSGQRVVVKGFTDDVPRGADLAASLAGNVELSKARADAVAQFLAARGVPSTIVYDTGLGETHPVARNDTPQGRVQNRRVEIDVVEAPA